MRQSPILGPRRLLFQILELQAFYYVIGLALITFSLAVGGTKWSLDYVLSWKPVRADTSLGWTLSFLWLLDTFFSVLAVAVIVGRSKLALDFALTLHLINIIVTWVYTGEFPRSWLWWTLQALSAALLVTLGIYTTQWRELRKSFFEDYEMVDLQRSRAGDQAQTATVT